MTYSSAISVNRQKYSARGQNAVSFKSESKRLGPISNAITLLVLVCLIGLVYLTQVTKTNSFSYDINTLEQQQSQLKEEQKDLELTAARLRSVDSESVAGAAQALVSVAPSGTISE
ncbi:MAG: Tfp pilus assembly protein PilN [Candidatus Saccharimonadales bacterium]|jgi:Tfp pilus assembly protein PilN